MRTDSVRGKVGSDIDELFEQTVEPVHGSVEEFVWSEAFERAVLF